MPGFSESLSVEGPKRSMDAYLFAVEDEARSAISSTSAAGWTGRPWSCPREGVVLTEKLADMLGVEPGDTITLDGDKRVEVPVTAPDGELRLPLRIPLLGVLRTALRRTARHQPHHGPVYRGHQRRSPTRCLPPSSPLRGHLQSAVSGHPETFSKSMERCGLRGHPHHRLRRGAGALWCSST